ncbi:MAG: hypothetical protein DMF59_12005 [Acidobacteria bacterium]|nr:MAG: hypothetical protein DMF59_12005 [Acidobacteriota bacterium]
MRILAVLAAMIVPLAFYIPVYQEREKAVERADEEIRKLDTRIEQAHAAQRKLTQFHEEVQSQASQHPPSRAGGRPDSQRRRGCS